MPAPRFLFEVGVGNKAERTTADLGFDVKSLRSIDVRLDDSEILQIARTEHRVVVTMDKDFGELVYRRCKGHVGVLLLRMDDANGDAKANAMKSIVLNHADELSNAFSVYQHGVLRIRTREQLKQKPPFTNS
jgi:predicted nuclease of predicted toxin-antitoxin system